jgi:hypothetical protein
MLQLEEDRKVKSHFKVMQVVREYYYYYSSSSTGFFNSLAGFSLFILEVSRSHTMTQHSR